MNWKLSSALFIFACCSAVSAATYALSNNPHTANARQTNPVVYTTPPKTAISKLKEGESDVHEIRGKATFMVTAANFNDTVTGTLIYSLSDEDRKRIAQVSGKPMSSVPASVVKKDLVAGFEAGAACPVVSLEIAATELEVAGVKLSFNRIVADIIETQENVPQHFCAWTRQINAKRQRRGIIASLNRLITGED